MIDTDKDRMVTLIGLSADSSGLCRPCRWVVQISVDGVIYDPEYPPSHFAGPIGPIESFKEHILGWGDLDGPAFRLGNGFFPMRELKKLYL